MDLSHLREKIVTEVLRQLESNAANAPAVPPAASGTAPAAAGAAPAPGATAAGTPPLHLACAVNPEATVPDRIDVLVLLTGRDEVSEGLAEARTLVQQGYRATLVTTPELLDKTGPGLLHEVLGGGITICHGDEALAKRLVQVTGVVLVPALSVAVAAQASNLLSNDFPSAVLVQAILAKRPVVAARDALRAGPEPVPYALRRRLEEYRTALKGYGVVLAEARRLAVEAGRLLGGDQPVQRRSAAVPSAAAAPAAAQAGDWDRTLASLIDHTLLKPDATAEQIARACAEARQYGFASVCVNAHWVPFVAERLQGSSVKICAVVGFPLGATTSTAKALEARDAIQKGAGEIDMVLNVGALKSGQHETVAKDIQAVVEAARGRALVKVILETGFLTDAEKVKACELAKAAGADFVKTSTGFGPGGATVADVALMRKTVGPEMGVKASGGIRDQASAQAMVKAGASRLGCSASVAIVTGGQGKDKY